MKPLIAIFYTPGSVFNRNLAKPVWAIPITASLLIQTVLTFWITHRIGIQVSIQRSLDPFRDRFSPQDLQEMARSLATPQMQAVGHAIGLLRGCGEWLCAAYLVYFLTRFVAPAATFKTCCSLLAYVSYAYHLVHALLCSVVLAVAPDPSDLDLLSPFRFDPALLLDRANTPRWIYTLLSSFGLLELAAVGLLSLGLFTSLRNVPFKTALAIAGVVFLSGVAARTLWALLP